MVSFLSKTQKRRKCDEYNYERNGETTIFDMTEDAAHDLVSPGCAGAKCMSGIVTAIEFLALLL
jgi:hypothetical protein